MKNPETKIQNEIIAYLKKLQSENYPIFYQRREAGGFSYKEGIPDLYIVINGKHIEVEIKTKDGKLSIMQEKFRDKCNKINICWCCVRSLEEFKIFLKSIKKSLLLEQNMI